MESFALGVLVGLLLVEVIKHAYAILKDLTKLASRRMAPKHRR